MSFIEEAHKNAGSLDAAASAQLRTNRLEGAKRLFYTLRAYLVQQARGQIAQNDIYAKIKFVPPDANGMALITMGPSMDKGPTEEHFNFDSGSRLSFLVAVRETKGTCELITFRFHHQFAEGRSPLYLRFDLNKNTHERPLHEPRCHLHPGIEHVRLPTPVLHPVEILDRVFFVIESEA